METTTRITIKGVAERWKKQYCRDGKWGDVYLANRGIPSNAETVHRAVLQAKNLNDVDRIIGNENWTHNTCSECGTSKRGPMAVFDVNGGEYEHLLCKPCLQKALTLIT